MVKISSIPKIKSNILIFKVSLIQLFHPSCFLYKNVLPTPSSKLGSILTRPLFPNVCLSLEVGVVQLVDPYAPQCRQEMQLPSPKK